MTNNEIVRKSLQLQYDVLTCSTKELINKYHTKEQYLFFIECINQCLHTLWEEDEVLPDVREHFAKIEEYILHNFHKYRSPESDFERVTIAFKMEELVAKPKPTKSKLFSFFESRVSSKTCEKTYQERLNEILQNLEMLEDKSTISYSEKDGTYTFRRSPLFHPLRHSHSFLETTQFMIEHYPEYYYCDKPLLEATEQLIVDSLEENYMNSPDERKYTEEGLPVLEKVTSLKKRQQKQRRKEKVIPFRPKI